MKTKRLLRFLIGRTASAHYPEELEMLRVVRDSACYGFENNCLLYRHTTTGKIVDAPGNIRVRRTGGFWNCHTYEFPDPAAEPYSLRPAEAALKWSFGVPFISQERIESEGFSGVVTRQQVADQLFFNLGNLEWRFDQQQRELYYEVTDSKIEMRSTLLAFRFYLGNLGD